MLLVKNIMSVPASWSNFASIESLDIQVPMISSIYPLLKYNRFIPSCLREYISQNTSRRKFQRLKRRGNTSSKPSHPFKTQPLKSQEALNLLKGERPAACLPFRLLMTKLYHMVPWRNAVKCREIQKNAENCNEMQRNAEKCIEMHRNAEKCRELQWNAMKWREMQINAE